MPALFFPNYLLLPWAFSSSLTCFSSLSCTSPLILLSFSYPLVLEEHLVVHYPIPSPSCWDSIRLRKRMPYASIVVDSKATTLPGLDRCGLLMLFCCYAFHSCSQLPDDFLTSSLPPILWTHHTPCSTLSGSSPVLIRSNIHTHRLPLPRPKSPWKPAAPSPPVRNQASRLVKH